MSDLSLTDVGNLNQAGLSERQRLERVAAQFEAQFLQLLLKESQAWNDGDDDDIFGSSPALDQFQDMLHSALAESSAGGMGISEMIVRQMLPTPPAGGA
ncbi:MAG: hypothetical protein EA402_09120 [Planctomycetota bacterium]|nr:MAG: hypothetical protein EA402_09120 [Planctomycetota bacterium]